jgi:UDPglucose--hexose-1-phosphate uridylyltransferase
VTERRYDPTADEWVTVASHRQQRTYKPAADVCPLCPSRPGGPGTELPRPSFEVAVFDNRFPSLLPDPPAPSVLAAPPYAVAPATGRCEVVVYSDDHAATFADLPGERVRMVVDVWADRYRTLGAVEDVRYVLPFENKGDVIGVTLSHPHGQVYAYPEVPPRPLRALRAGQRYRERTGRCVWCDVMAAEDTGPRRVARGRTTLAVVPFAPRFPYEVQVVTTGHRPSLLDLDDAERDDLAAVLHRVVRGYDALFGFSLPYVLAVQMRPTDEREAWDDVSHLHVELTPPHRGPDRLKHLAGSELAAGAFLDDVAPESAAARLREAMP